MYAKLTLRLNDELIASAKRHSAESGKSVSKLVSDFFALIDARDTGVEITSCVRSHRDVLAGSGPDESDYRRRLEEKYR